MTEPDQFDRADRVSQIDWSSWRFDVSWSIRPSRIHRRFSIMRTTSGFTVNDHQEKETVRFQTFAAAKAWAGIRVNETCVRHG